MSSGHNRATIISIAVIASACATLIHEGLGHGIIAWLRDDIPTELTSNHLSALRTDRWVDSAGTIANLLFGSASMLAMRAAGARANLRYFLWIFAAMNLLPAGGYFMLSGIVGFGDWYEVIRGLPHQLALRVAMTLFGAALYLLFVRWLAVAIRPFVAVHADYNTVGRIAYYAAGLFECAAGAFDPIGIKMLLVSTIPAAFGGSSGLMWADSLMPRTPPAQPLIVKRQPAWWIAAVILGGIYIVVIGRGIQIPH